jgi:hypothetical protein
MRGPGVIQPPITICLNQIGPNQWGPPVDYPHQGVYNTWGSFIGTNVPIIYPPGPVNTNSTAFQLALAVLQPYTYPPPILYCWNLNAPLGALYSVQTSTNLIDWSTVATITNIGSTFTYLDTVLTNIPQIYYRTVPQ